jgi:hypothetical protein
MNLYPSGVQSLNRLFSFLLAMSSADSGFDFKLYRYDPSLPAAIVSTVVFAVLSVLHTWRLIRVRAYYFTPFVVGGFCRFTIHLSRSCC